MNHDHLSTAKFDVTIKSKSINVKEKGIPYQQAKQLVESTVSENPEDEELQDAYASISKSFGFIGISKGSFEFSVSAYRDRITLDEKQTCPRRMGEFGPWERKENLDSWELRGDDKCCSFCGSMHPDRVLELVEQFGFSIIGPTTKGYKYYIHRDSVPNAGFGGIKFYVQHFSPQQREKYNSLQIGRAHV